MKLFSILLFIVLSTILQFSNAVQHHLYRDKTTRSWFTIAVLSRNESVITQECIHMYFVPQKDNLWAVVMVEYSQPSDLTVVESRTITSYELDKTHEDAALQFKIFLNLDSERHFIFYEKNRQFYLVLSRTPGDQIFIIDDTSSNGWSMKSMITIPPVGEDSSKLHNPLTPTCGNNVGGDLDKLRDELTEAIIKRIRGQWYTVAFLKNADIDIKQNCVQKYFAPKFKNALSYFTLENGPVGTLTKLSSGTISSDVLYELYNYNVDHVESLVNFDKNDYFFVTDNPNFYHILSRSPNVTISLKDDSSISEKNIWSLQQVNQKNCHYDLGPKEKTATEKIRTEIAKARSDCETATFTTLCEVMKEISSLSSKAFHYALNHGSLFKLIKRLFKY